MDIRQYRQQYVLEFKDLLNHQESLKHVGGGGGGGNISMYRPTDIRFVALGGQSKIFSFRSETLERDLIIKVYDTKFAKQAEQEYRNMHLLNHDSLLQVYQIGTIQPLESASQNQAPADPSSDGLGVGVGGLGVMDANKDDMLQNVVEIEQLQNLADKTLRHSESSSEDSDPENEGIGKKKSSHERETFYIIMEKATCTLLDDIQFRRSRRQPYSRDELLEYWKSAVDVLAYCSSSGIAHCDIKPSNLLLVKDDSKAGGVSLKISDFGTSINVSPESKNMQLIMKESAFTNFNKFMTPLYASPNIIQKASKINYYLEDVFSLGVSFVQMAGPYTSDELCTFSLNGIAASTTIDLTNTKQPMLEMALNKCQSNLTYFHRELLKRMLALEAEERPNFQELREIFECPQLNLNLENEAFVDSLMREKISNNQSVGANNAANNLGDTEIQSQAVANEDEEPQRRDTMYQIGGMMGGATMQIRQLQGGATKLISGIPQFEQVEYKVAAKAIYQSSDLMLLNLTRYLESPNTNMLGNSTTCQNLILYKPATNEVQTFHMKDRPHLFLSECATVVTPEGQIFVLGGKNKCSYTRANIELVVDLFVNQHPQAQQILASKKLPISFRYMKNVGHYFVIPRRDMLIEKSSFGHCTTKTEIFIAGGQDSKSSELSRVESYDIKRDSWKNLPALKNARFLPSLCMFRQRFLYTFGGQNHSKDQNQIKFSFQAKFISTIERLDVREGSEWEVVQVKSGEKIKGHSLNSLQISATEILVFGSYFWKQSPTFEKIKTYIFDHDKSTIRDQALKGEDDDEGFSLVDGSFTDSVTTSKGLIFAFNSYSAFNKKLLKDYHKFRIADLLQQPAATGN